MKITFQQASLLAQKHLSETEVESIIRIITPRKVAQLLSLNPEFSLRQIESSRILEILEPSRAVYFYTVLINGKVESIFDFIDYLPEQTTKIKIALQYLLESVDEKLTKEWIRHLKSLFQKVFLGLKQEDIATRLGVVRPHYNAIINWKKPFSKAVFCSLLLELRRFYTR
jgi:predicted XRE-type DNA-binding protein